MAIWVFFVIFSAFCLIAKGYNYTNMKKCEINRQQNTVNCSHRSLHEILNSTFLPSTRKIDLSSNIITSVENFTFSGVSQLETLDLSSNHIGYLEPMAFVGLGRLLSLNLSINWLTLIPEIFSPTLFEPLQRLSTLRFQMYTPTMTDRWKGIDRGFSMLTNLENLFMDIPIYFTFGPGFARLTKLKTFSTTGRPRDVRYLSCTLLKLTNKTFESLKHTRLQELRLPNCVLLKVESGTFLHLQHLTILDLSNNDRLGLKKALWALYGLQDRHMKEINFSSLNYYGFPSRDLYDSDMVYLKSICVRFLDLSENFIFYNDHGPSFGKPECFEMLNVSSRSMRCLTTSVSDDIPIHRQYLNMEGTYNGHVRMIKNESTDRITDPPLYRQARTQSAQDISAMPSLLALGTSNCFLWSFFYEMLAVNGSANFPNLRSLDMSYNQFSACQFPSGIETLTELDVSGFPCDEFYEFLENYPRLRKLTVRNAPNLYIGIENPGGAGDSFCRLPDLQDIDLSENKLTELNRDLFITNTHLRSISLSNNKLQRVPSAIMQLNNISMLDLSTNAFSYLNNDEMLLMDRFSEAQYGKSRFHLNLGDNPLQCTCETLDFILWMYTNERFLDRAGNYTCALSNGSRVDLAGFKEKINNLSVSCVSHTWLIVAVVSILFISLILMLLYAVYRYRVNLRYWFYTKLQPPVEMLVQKEYVYDAFVAYTEDNYQWVYDDLHRLIENGEQPIKLCLHNRDFTPGKPIHENIVDKMRQSRKIVLVVSVDFLNSTYGPLEIEYAGMKSLEEGREDIIVCILLEEIPAREMPKALRNLWHKITFLKWPGHPREQVHFWQKLREAITNNVM